MKKRRFEPQGIKNSMINARDYKSRAASNHEQPVTNHKQPTAKDALELFGRNSIGKALFFAYLSEL